MNESEQRLAEGFLFTDFYQLTMAQLYFREGMHEVEAQFEHFFRSYPHYGDHSAGYCINAGMGWFLDWLGRAKISTDDLDALRAQRSRSGKRLFDEDFLSWLKEHGTFESLRIHAIPEGRVVHAGVPLTVVEGPLIMAQIIETALLAQLNYQTLIATKAARIKSASGGALVLEFGARRAHDRAANAGARAALIGGADFTSNVGISTTLGFAPKGTHAHSLVQSYVALGFGELEAFRAYAKSYPDECVLLVDTIDTLNSGIPNAIKVFHELRAQGHEPVGIRLDSGDLAYLSIQAAKALDEAGFPNATITLSSNLDELVIWQILTQIRQEAPFYGQSAEAIIRRITYGVGTRLITSEGANALGGVYKLVALKQEGKWKPTIKLSNSEGKATIPGQKKVWRIYDHRQHATADVLSCADETLPVGKRLRLYHPQDPTRTRVLSAGQVTAVEPLLELAYLQGDRKNDDDILHMRQRRVRDLSALDSGVRRLVNPHIYHVSLSAGLWQLRNELIERLTETLDAEAEVSTAGTAGTVGGQNA